MGSGVGITLYGTHRVAGERYKFAMPECAIGLFPDVGVAYTLARLPDAIGMYLGLTGRSIGPADAYALGLVTHCIPAARYEEIKTALAETWPVDPLLDERHLDPGPRELAPYTGVIARCFSAGSVEEILARLAAVDGAERGFAEGVIADLKARSPLSLKVTHRHIRDARALDLRQTLMVDYRLACRFLEGHDFYEGVRAALIDKDGKPGWQPQRLEEVTPAMVEDYFASMGSGELALPTRQEMQAARV
jgi:enoyl-CoA hydratase